MDPLPDYMYNSVEPGPAQRVIKCSVNEQPTRYQFEYGSGELAPCPIELASCPTELDEDEWDIIDKKEMERQQLTYIYGIIKDTLYAEYARRSDDVEAAVRGMDIDIRYKTIEITIKKVNARGRTGVKQTLRSAAKNILYTCSEVAAFHPLKTIGAVAIILKLL